MSEDAVHDAYSDVPIPLVPGMGLNDGMPRARPRTQHLGFVNGIPARSTTSPTALAPPRARAGKPAARPTSAASTAAPWEKHDPSWGHLGRPRTARADPPRAPPPPARSPPGSPTRASPFSSAATSKISRPPSARVSPAFASASSPSTSRTPPSHSRTSRRQQRHRPGAHPRAADGTRDPTVNPSTRPA